MALTIGGTARRIGLALSGGGFRAAAFHLGVMRRLAALGILEHVDLFTCVSGGSIAGATVIKHWADPARLDILDRYLRTRSIAVSSVIGGVLDPFEDRLDKLAASYDRDLFDGATLDGLGGGPRLYVNATNLATGTKWNGVNVLTNTQIDGNAANGLTKNTSSPGFVDMANGNFLTTSSSPYALLNGNLPDGIVKRGLAPAAEPVTAAASEVEVAPSLPRSPVPHSRYPPRHAHLRHDGQRDLLPRAQGLHAR